MLSSTKKRHTKRKRRGRTLSPDDISARSSPRLAATTPFERFVTEVQLLRRSQPFPSALGQVFVRDRLQSESAEAQRPSICLTGLGGERFRA